MDQMIVLDLGTMEQIANQAGVWGDFDTNGVFDCPHRGQSMDVRSDPAGALHKMLRVTRIAPQ